PQWPQIPIADAWRKQGARNWIGQQDQEGSGPEIERQSMWYEIVLKADDNDTWLVTAPAFPEMATFGQTRDDAYGHARAAIEEAIAARIARNEDVPAPMADRAGSGW